jgi:hypothetical protein
MANCQRPHTSVIAAELQLNCSTLILQQLLQPSDMLKRLLTRIRCQHTTAAAASIKLLPRSPGAAADQTPSDVTTCPKLCAHRVHTTSHRVHTASTASACCVCITGTLCITSCGCKFTCVYSIALKDFTTQPTAPLLAGYAALLWLC